MSGRGRNPTAVEQLDADGNVIATYSGAKAAARALNVSYSGVANVCAGKRLTICGMRFRYADVPSEPRRPAPQAGPPSSQSLSASMRNAGPRRRRARL